LTREDSFISKVPGVDWGDLEELRLLVAAGAGAVGEPEPPHLPSAWVLP